MGKINWFKAYLQEIQDQIKNDSDEQLINRNKLVVDDSQLTNYLQNHRRSDNAMLIGVLPEFGANASDPDNFLFRASTMLMVLNKTNYSAENYDSYFQIFEDTYIIAEKIVKKLLTDSMAGCTYLRYLQPQSIQIVPVWNKSECEGWSIQFNFDATL